MHILDSVPSYWTEIWPIWTNEEVEKTRMEIIVLCYWKTIKENMFYKTIDFFQGGMQAGFGGDPNRVIIPGQHGVLVIEGPNAQQEFQAGSLS